MEDIIKVKRVSRKRSTLLKRTEITFEDEHPYHDSPRRSEVRKRLAEVVNSDFKLLFIKSLVMKNGSMTVVGEANVYDSLDQARVVEPKHLLPRNVKLEGSEK